MKLHNEHRINWLICTTLIPPIHVGGGENAYRCAQYLTQVGDNVSIFSFRIKGIDPCSTNGIKNITCPFPNSRIKKIFLCFFIPIKLFPILYKTDIVYIIGSTIGFQPIIILSSKILLKKIIFRSTMLPKDSFDSILTIKNPIRRSLLRYTLPKIDLYLAINKEFEIRWKKTFPSKIGSIVLTPQGVDNLTYYPSTIEEKELLRRKLNLPSIDVPIIISVGNVIKRKGYKDIFEALHNIEDNFLYIVLGEADGNSKYRIDSPNLSMTELVNFGKQLLGSKIAFLGYVNNAYEYYRSSDIFIHNSEQEGLPNSLLEAMNCALPVICNRLDGVTDWILTNENCIICENKYDITEATIKLLKSSSERSKLGIISRNSIKDITSFDHLYEIMTSVL